MAMAHTFREDTRSMHQDELIRLYPKLHHMAAPDAWPSIVEYGLLSTRALLDLFEVHDPLREQLLSEHRPRSVTITHPTLGTAVVRDQKPLSPTKLAGCLDDDLTVSQWLQTLNSQVFFWLQPERLERLLSARAYRSSDHLVITIDTARLLAQTPDTAITISRINSGSTVYQPVRRGQGTFLSIADYPHPSRRRALASASDVAELCVTPAVHDILNIADQAELRGVSGRHVLWTRWQD